MANRTLNVNLTARDAGLTRGLRGAGTELDRFGRKVDDSGRKVHAWGTISSRGIGRAHAAVAGLGGVAVAVATGGIAQLGKAVVGTASDINESLTKNQVLFGRFAKDVNRFSQDSAASFGVSRQAALEYTGVFGNLFRALDVSREKSAQFSVNLTKLAADMASFNNTSIDDALEAIRSGLVGETEPLRRFGVNLQDVTLRQEAMSLGLTKTTKNVLTPYQRAMAAQALIVKQTTAAHGDFHRTQGGLANQTRILQARLSDLEAEAGRKLLPTALKLVSGFNKLIDQWKRGTGTGGEIRRTVEGIGSSLQTVGRFLDDHRQMVKLAVEAWAAWRLSILAVGKLSNLRLPMIPGGGAAGGAASGAAGGAAAGAAGGAAAGRLASRLPGSLRVVGGTAAGIAALKIGTDFIKGYAHADAAVKVFSGRVKELTSSGNREGLRRLANEIRHYADVNQGSFSDSGKAARKYADDVEHALDRTQDSFRFNREKFRAMRDDLRSNWGLMERDAGSSLGDIRKNVRTNAALIKQRLGNDTAEGRKAVQTNFRLAADAVERQMHRGAVSTRKGTQEIRSLLVRGLQALGLSQNQAEAKLDNGTLQKGSARTPGQGLAPTRAGGGWIGRPGERGTDQIPIMVGRGEAVLNRHQQAVIEGFMGGGFLDRLFSTVQTPHYLARGGKVKGFAGGGIVGVPGFPGERAASSVIPAIEMIAKRFGLVLTDAYGQGHKSPGHTKYGTAADFAGPDKRMDAAVQYLVRRGYTVGYDGRFGSQAWPGHGPSYVAGGNAHLHVELGGRGGALSLAVPKIRGFGVRGAGAAGAMANRAVRIMQGAANQRMRSVANSQMMAPVGGGGGGGYSKGQLKSLWVRAGGDPKVANLMAAIALAESGGRSGIVNSIGATGLWQIHPGGSQYLNPLVNARTAVSKLRSQGLRAWEAYTNGSYRQYLARGGFVGAAKGLSPRQQQALARKRALGAHGRAVGRAKQNVTYSPAQSRRINARANRRAGVSLTDYYAQSLDAAAAQADLTPGTEDDLQVARNAEKFWRGMLSQARRRGDQEGIQTAAQNLKAARDTIAELTAPVEGPSQDDVFGAQLAIAGLTGQDTTPILQQQLAYHQKRYDYASAIAASGNTDALVTAGQEADQVKQLTDALNANTDAIKASQADLATELKRQNDLQQTIFGSQSTAILQGIADMVGGQIGGRVGLGYGTPSFAGGRVRY